jgi:hypothetical protein
MINKMEKTHEKQPPQYTDYALSEDGEYNMVEYKNTINVDKITQLIDKLKNKLEQNTQYIKEKYDNLISEKQRILNQKKMKLDEEFQMENNKITLLMNQEISDFSRQYELQLEELILKESGTGIMSYIYSFIYGFAT